jgi:hypothetical protein
LCGGRSSRIAGAQARRWRRTSDRRGPLILTEPHTTRPVNTTWGVPSAGATLRLSLALPPYTSTSSMDALAPSGNRISTEPNRMSSSITTTGPANLALTRSSFDRAHAAHQRQPSGYRPFAVPLKRSGPAAQLDAVGGRGDDRPGPGQIAHQAVELIASPGIGHVRRPLLELTDVDQPEGDRVVQPPQGAVAVGIGDAQLGQFIGTCHGDINLPPSAADEVGCTSTPLSRRVDPDRTKLESSVDWLGGIFATSHALLIANNFHLAHLIDVIDSSVKTNVDTSQTRHSFDRTECPVTRTPSHMVRQTEAFDGLAGLQLAPQDVLPGRRHVPI